jgi:mRNA-degrading endonuclease YafQ of YafQ-DinJ toxin-antitoxin module
MLFRRTREFEDDFERLPRDNQDDIKAAFTSVSNALEGNEDLYKKFKIKKMRGHPNVWEGHIKYNLCFTFHIAKGENGEKICFFRRIGTHDIYNKP